MKNNTVVLITLGNAILKIMLQNFPGSGKKAGYMVHSHAMYELHILYRGSAKLEVEGRSLPLRQGDCALVCPHTFHVFKSQEEDAVILSLGFFLESNEKREGVDVISLLQKRFSQENGIWILRQNDRVIQYINRLIVDDSLSHPFFDDVTKALFVLIFSELFRPLYVESDSRQKAENEMSEGDKRACLIEDYFNHHYMEDISLKKLAVLLCLGEKQTNRMIYKVFGEHFRERLSKMRLRAAEKLLKDSDMGVKDVAEAVGYQSYNGFYLAFKSKMGMTPYAYRAHCQNRSKE